MTESKTGIPRAWSGSGRLSANLILVLILVSGALLRLLTLTRESLWFDELYVVWARRLPLDELVPEIAASEHPPVYNFIGYFWEFLGRSEFLARSLSALIGTALILLVYLTAKELFSRRAGLWAAAFAAVAPLLVWYSRDATSYAWVITISTASLYTLTRACLRGGRGNWTAYVLVTAIAVFSHVASGAILVAGIFYFLILRERGKANLKPWIVSQLILFTLLILMLSILSYYGREIDTAYSGLPQLADKSLTAFSNAVYIVLLGYKNQAFGSPTAVPLLTTRQVVLVIFTLLLIAVPFLSRNVRRAFVNRKTAALFVYTIIMIAAPITVLLLRDTTAAGRYYAWAVPAVMILIAVIVAAPPNKISAVAGSIVVAGLLLSTADDLNSRYNDDWRGLMHTVAADRQPGDIMLCFPMHHCTVATDFYLDGDMRLLGGIYLRDEPETVYFWTAGEDWQGYGYRRGGRAGLISVPMDEKGTEATLARELDGSERIWYVSGSGLADNYPDVPPVEQALAALGWRTLTRYESGLLHMTVLERS